MLSFTKHLPNINHASSTVLRTGVNVKVSEIHVPFASPPFWR